MFVVFLPVFLLLLVAMGYFATRQYNLQVAVLDRGATREPIVAVAGDHLPAVYAAIISLLCFYMVAQIVRSVTFPIGTSPIVWLAAGLAYSVGASAIGAVFAGFTNHWRRENAKIRALAMFETGVATMTKEEEVGYKFKTRPVEYFISADNFIVIFTDPTDLATFINMSAKKRQRLYPILADANPHTS